MKQVFSPNAEMFRWGPLLMRPFYAIDFNKCLASDFPREYKGHSWPKSVMLKKSNVIVWLNDFSELRKSGGKLFLERMLPIDKREKSRTAWKKDKQDLTKFERKIDKINLQSLSDKEFMKLWRDFHNKTVRFWTHCVLPELSNYGSSEILREKLKKYIKDYNELNSAMEVLTAPLGMSFYQEEEIDLDETKNIKDHQKKYFWLKNSYAKVLVLGTDFFAERKKTLEKEVRKRVTALLENAARKKEEVRHKYNLPKEIMSIADAISDGIVWQDARKKEILIYLHYKDLLLNELARRYKLSKESLLDFDAWEIEKLLKTKDKILKTRKNFGWLCEKKIQTIDPKTTMELWEMYAEEKVTKETKEISGIIASKGQKTVVRGAVKIILDPHDANKLNEGDILVTTMTTPDFVFIMKRASAIVTDTGGLTSHAAIVSRELQKPCIVGTKIATKVFKDGDMVEVDANHGVVKILKRAEMAEEPQKDPTIIDNEKWILLGARNSSLWHVSATAIGNFRYLKEYGIDYPLRTLFVVIHHNRINEGVFFYIPTQLKQCGELLLKTMSGAKNIAKIRKTIEENAKSLWLSLENCNNHLCSRTWQKFVEQNERFLPTLFITYNLGIKCTDLLKAKLKSLGIPENDADRIIATITYPDENTPLFNSQKSMLIIGEKIQSGKTKDAKRELKKWLEDYGYIPVNFSDEPWTIKDAESQLNSLLGKNCKSELARIAKEQREKIEEKHKELSKIKDKDVHNLANVVAEATYLNEYRKNVISKVSLHYRQVFGKIAKMLGSNQWRDCYYLTPHEMTEVLEGKKLDLQKIISDRQHTGVYIDTSGDLKFMSKQEAENLVSYYQQIQGKKVSTEMVSSDTISGLSANRGIVRGIAKIIFNSKDFHKLNSGEIIVTNMTSVDFVSIMQKASAFVTNEGGITCHASIVSREMNKPCIIGTKIATQVIKDGDMVEVDANHGIVRILERAGEEKPASKEDLSDEYLRMVGKRKLWPPLNNYSVFIQGSEHNTQKYYGKWYDNKVRLDFFIHAKKGFSQVWFTEDDTKFASDFAFREYLHNPKKFNKRIDNLSSSIKKLNKLYDIYTYEKINRYNWDKLLPLVSEIRDTVWNANAGIIFSIYFDKKMCTDILNEEKYPLAEKELDKIWDKAIEPAFESFDKEQLIHVLGLIRDKTPWEKIIEQCQYILTDYHSARALSEVEKTVKERYGKYINNPKLASKTLKNELAGIKNTVKSHQDWIKSLPKNKKVIAQYLQLVMKVRDERKNSFAKGLTIIQRIAEKMFAEAGIDLDIIPFYSIKELLNGPSYLKSMKNSVCDRKNGIQWIVPYADEPRGLNINIDRGVEKINKHFRESHSIEEGSGIIKGQSGSKGVVKGKVRIVLDVNSDHGFKEGEILVTGMTRPEYVPLMKKALAIVTDEGGITCHAAIVSRELKKPCVVGTKIATKVLKDGDIVEVDADKGIVRKLERKK